MIPLPPQIEQLINAIYPPARQAMADELALAQRWLFALNAVTTLALTIAFYATGTSMRLRARLERWFGRRWLVAFAFIALALVGFTVLTLPLAWFGGFTLPHAYGLSREPPAQWLRDWVVALALDVVITGVVGTLFVLAAARFVRAWPLVAAIGIAPLIVFGFAVYPIYIAPLFNRYMPLPPSSLTNAILALSREEGVQTQVVYEFDMSRQTTEGNAYVAGIGKTERIAVSDTLIRNLRPDEVVYVFAHELGHYKLHHAWLGALYTWLDALGTILFLAIFSFVRPRTRYGDPATLPLVAVLLLVYGLVTDPVANAISRGMERAADGFATHAALAQAGTSPRAGVRAFARLASQNLAPLHPPRLAVWYFYTHPPMDERIMDAAGKP